MFEYTNIVMPEASDELLESHFHDISNGGNAYGYIQQAYHLNYPSVVAYVIESGRTQWEWEVMIFQEGESSWASRREGICGSKIVGMRCCIEKAAMLLNETKEELLKRLDEEQAMKVMTELG